MIWLSACTPDAGCPDGGMCLDASAAPVEQARPAIDKDAACLDQSVRAERGPSKRIDIVFVIDNSGSMAEEITAIRNNINQNFASLIRSSGVDFRVILLSLYGAADASVCIEPPLAGSACSAGLYATNSDVFFHYDVEVASTDALCLLLYTLDHPDPEQRAPHGFQDWLRPDAEKVFVVITDDSADCVYREGPDRVEFGAPEGDPFADALLFHETLLELAPDQFEKRDGPAYRFYSIVGLAPAQPASEPWFPDQPLNSSTCDTAPTPGLSYQALSILTDALRYPVCEGRGFDAVFRVLARNVIESSKLDCVFDLPTPPAEQAIDRTTIRIEYAAEGEEPNQLNQLPDESGCNARSFYIRDDRIRLCPQACERVQSDLSIEVDLHYGCSYVPQ